MNVSIIADFWLYTTKLDVIIFACDDLHLTYIVWVRWYFIHLIWGKKKVFFHLLWNSLQKKGNKRVIYNHINICGIYFPGMLPHKLHRGKDALERFKAFEGIPPPYDKMKRMVVPSALRIIRLKPRRKFCQLSRLSHEVGWKYQNVVATLEKRRKLKATGFHKKKVQENVRVS